jgi:hypothetical protein
VLRREPISKDLLIALFAGEPTLVTVSEPFKGMRFGVEPKVGVPNAYTACNRASDGSGNARVDVPMKADRVIAVRQLSDCSRTSNPVPWAFPSFFRSLRA